MFKLCLFICLCWNLNGRPCYLFGTLNLLFVPQAGQVNLAVGCLVWIEDPEVAWIDGEVVEVNGQDIRVLSSSGTTVSDTLQDVKLLYTADHSVRIPFVLHYCTYIKLL